MSSTVVITESDKQPLGLWFVSGFAALTSVGFAIIASLLVLYLMDKVSMAESASNVLFGAYMSQLFTLPLFGGFMGGLFGYRLALIIGSAFCVVACFLLMLPSVAFVYLGLGCFAVGVAYYVPNSYVIVGKMYHKDDHRRESGFTYMYMIMNVGFLVGGTAGAYLSEYLGYAISFATGGVFVLLAVILFLIGMGKMQPYPGRDLSPRYSDISTPLATLILVVVGLLVLPLVCLLLYYANINNILLLVLAIGAIALIISMALRQPNKLARNRLFAFIILSIISVGFWSLYMLEPSLLTEFIKTNVDRDLFGSALPPTLFYNLDPFFIITLGGLFSLMWIKLARIGRNPSLAAKFTLSMFLMATGFLLLSLVLSSQTGAVKMAFWWIILAYLFLTCAEMLIGPIGISMVGRLSPEGQEGLLMGVWQLFTGVSAGLSGYLANLATVPSGDNAASLITTNTIYASAFTKVGLFSLVFGIVALCLIPWVNRIMRNQ